MKKTYLLAMLGITFLLATSCNTDKDADEIFNERNASTDASGKVLKKIEKSANIVKFEKAFFSYNDNVNIRGIETAELMLVEESVSYLKNRQIAVDPQTKNSEVIRIALTEIQSELKELNQ